MAATVQQDAGQRDRPRWLILLRPRWLAWHAFAVVAFLGMLWLGRWQLHRAESGNELSWAYTIEWPLFAVAGGYFWLRTLREELQAHGSHAEPDGTKPAAAEAAADDPDGQDGQAAADAYMERLKAEVARHGRWHGWR